MKRIVRGLLAIGGILLAATPGHATPFVLGGQVCGTLTKVRSAEGVAWKVVGCPQLERLAACGNGMLEGHEVCDRSVPSSCPGAKVCVACEACVRQGTTSPPTPTPTPAWTPTPFPIAGCPEGELPPLGPPFDSGQVGRDFVSIAGGATHRYCVTTSGPLTRLQAFVASRTAGQCSWFDVTVTPPVGSGLASRGDSGTDAAVTYFTRTGSLPQGVWTISITVEPFEFCAHRYFVVVDRD